MKFLMTLVLSIASSIAFGQYFPITAFGNQVGNGGKGVVCGDGAGNITRVEVLDFYEGRILYGLEPVFPDGTFVEKAKAAASRFAVHDSARAWRYTSEIDHFLSNTRYVDSPLIETPDSDHIVAPPLGCEIRQIAIQMKPTFPGDRLFTIDRTLWSHLGESDKAGLILHEVIYTEGIARGHKNSVAVRYLNTIASSDSISKMSDSEYKRILKAGRFASIDFIDQIGNVWTYLDSIDLKWPQAKEACKEIVGSALPSTNALLNSAPYLIRSEISDFIKEADCRDSWTADRRSQDGYMAVGSWSGAGIDIFYRQSMDVANVVCLKTKS